MTFGPEDRYSWIVPYLMLGAYPRIQDLAALRRAGIGAILSVRDAAEPHARYRKHGLAHLQSPIRDFQPPDVPQLGACCAFINEQRDQGRAVLVHCELGVGRSAAIALAYLAAKDMALGDAFALLREKRPRIGPSAAQLAAVAAYIQSRR